MTVHNEVGSLIDWYNCQFYNQADTQYNTYQELFVHSTGTKFNNTAVKEVVARGVDQSKIIIGKPATPRDATNTGYITAEQFGAFASQAKREGIWNNPGIMTW